MKKIECKAVKTWSLLTVVVMSTVLFWQCHPAQAPVDPICSRPGSEKSMICPLAAKVGLTPEELDGILLDTTTIAAMQFGRDRILIYAKEVRSLVAGQGVSMSYVVLLAKATKLAEDQPDAEMLARTINRRAKDIFSSTRIISRFDRQLILDHLDHQIAMLGG
jgi:hypothetical protein